MLRVERTKAHKSEAAWPSVALGPLQVVMGARTAPESVGASLIPLLQPGTQMWWEKVAGTVGTACPGPAFPPWEPVWAPQARQSPLSHALSLPPPAHPKITESACHKGERQQGRVCADAALALHQLLLCRCNVGPTGRRDHRPQGGQLRPLRTGGSTSHDGHHPVASGSPPHPGVGDRTQRLPDSAPCQSPLEPYVNAGAVRRSHH